MKSLAGLQVSSRPWHWAWGHGFGSLGLTDIIQAICNLWRFKWNIYGLLSQVDDPELLEHSMERFFRWAEGSAVAREILGDKLLDVNGLELVQKPIETMSKICQFIGITCSANYLQACAKVVDPNPSITRNYVVWSKEQMNRMYSEIEQYPFLAHYTYQWRLEIYSFRKHVYLSLICGY